MMFLGLFTLLVLPLFLFVSAQMILHGENDHTARLIGGILLYGMAAITVAAGLLYIFTH